MTGVSLRKRVKLTKCLEVMNTLTRATTRQVADCMGITSEQACGYLVNLHLEGSISDDGIIKVNGRNVTMWRKK